MGFVGILVVVRDYKLLVGLELSEVEDLIISLPHAVFLLLRLIAMHIEIFGKRAVPQLSLFLTTPSYMT